MFFVCLSSPVLNGQMLQVEVPDLGRLGLILDCSTRSLDRGLWRIGVTAGT